MEKLYSFVCKEIKASLCQYTYHLNMRQRFSVMTKLFPWMLPRFHAHPTLVAETSLCSEKQKTRLNVLKNSLFP